MIRRLFAFLWNRRGFFLPFSWGALVASGVAAYYGHAQLAKGYLKSGDRKTVTHNSQTSYL